MRLAAENISFQYDNGNRKILNNVSMSLEQDERVGITAPADLERPPFVKYLPDMKIRTMGVSCWMESLFPAMDPTARFRWCGSIRRCP